MLVHQRVCLFDCLLPTSTHWLRLRMSLPDIMVLKAGTPRCIFLSCLDLHMAGLSCSQNNQFGRPRFWSNKFDPDPYTSYRQYTLTQIWLYTYIGEARISLWTNKNAKFITWKIKTTKKTCARHMPIESKGPKSVMSPMKCLPYPSPAGRPRISSPRGLGQKKKPGFLSHNGLNRLVVQPTYLWSKY